MKQNNIIIQDLSTEIHYLKKLTQAFNGPNLYMKRVDNKLLEELEKMLDFQQDDFQIDYIVTEIGRLDLYVALLLANKLSKTGAKLIGICTNNNVTDSVSKVLQKIKTVKKQRNLDVEINREDIVIMNTNCIYKSPNEQIEAIKLLANKEAIFLDHHQSGKALAKLFECIKKDYFLKDNGVLFCHTGESPALMAKR